MYGNGKASPGGLRSVMKEMFHTP